MQIAEIQKDTRAFLIETFLFGRSVELKNEQALLGTVIDSTGVLELVGFLQEHFSIVVADEDVTPENLNSVDTITTYVQRKLLGKA